MPADVVVVGVGVAPATDWLDGSGLELRDGVVCDATLCAGVPGVYAAGDVARWPNDLYGEEMRVEHWTNAAEQGAAAAHNLLVAAAGGVRRPPTRRCRSSGATRLPTGSSCSAAAAMTPTSRCRCVGSPADGRFLALYGRRGRLRGALGVNAPRLVMPYRPLLAAGATWDDALALAREQRHT